MGPTTTVDDDKNKLEDKNAELPIGTDGTGGNVTANTTSPIMPMQSDGTKKEGTKEKPSVSTAGSKGNEESGVGTNTTNETAPVTGTTGQAGTASETGTNPANGTVPGTGTKGQAGKTSETGTNPANGTVPGNGTTGQAGTAPVTGTNEEDKAEDNKVVEEAGKEGKTTVPDNTAGENGNISKEEAKKGDKEAEEDGEKKPDSAGGGAEPGKTPQNSQEGLKEVEEETKDEMRELATNISSGEKSGGNEEQGNSAFHTMKELAEAKEQDQRTEQAVKEQEAKDKAEKEQAEKEQGTDQGKEKTKKEKGKGKEKTKKEKGKGKEKTKKGKEKENPTEEEEKPATPKELSDKIKRIRNGQFYKAVILARSLEQNKGNPLRGVRKRDVAKRRMGRFFNSSKLDLTSDVMKLAGAASGALGTFDAGYKDSFVAKGISLVTNFTAFVKSLHEVIKKGRQFKNLPTKTDKFFSIMGMVTDIVTMLAKGAAMAKTIAGFAGQVREDGKGVFGTIWDRVTLLLNSITQIGGILGASRALHKNRDGMGKQQAAEKMQREKVNEIAKKYTPQQTEDAKKAGSEEEAPPVLESDSPKVKEAKGKVKKHKEKKEEKKEEGRKTIKEKIQAAKADSNERKKTQETATELLKNDDVSPDDKDELAVYLAMCRRLKNTRKGIASGAMGLLTTVTALGSSIASSVKYNTDTKDSTDNAVKYMGLAANGMVIASTATKMGIGDRNKKNQDTEEGDMIQERLWHIIDSIKDDEKFGLKKIDSSMEVLAMAERAGVDVGKEESSAVMEQANVVASKYTAAEGQYKAAGVDYGQLFSVENLRDFKKALIAGI